MTNNFTESDFEFGDFFLNKKREFDENLDIKLERSKNKQGILLITFPSLCDQKKLYL